MYGTGTYDMKYDGTVRGYRIRIYFTRTKCQINSSILVENSYVSTYVPYIRNGRYEQKIMILYLFLNKKLKEQT